MSQNDWNNYPTYKPMSRFKRPLFDTGNRTGAEEIRDGAKWLGGKIRDGLKKLAPKKSETRDA